MRIATEAWRLREAARRALLLGEFELAFELAGSAQRTQATPAGEALLRLGEWQSAFRADRAHLDRRKSTSLEDLSQ
jgi:hypothetical protein